MKATEPCAVAEFKFEAQQSDELSLKVSMALSVIMISPISH